MHKNLSTRSVEEINLENLLLILIQVNKISSLLLPFVFSDVEKSGQVCRESDFCFLISYSSELFFCLFFFFLNPLHSYQSVSLETGKEE